MTFIYQICQPGMVANDGYLSKSAATGGWLDLHPPGGSGNQYRTRPRISTPKRQGSWGISHPLQQSLVENRFGVRYWSCGGHFLAPMGIVRAASLVWLLRRPPGEAMQVLRAGDQLMHMAVLGPQHSEQDTCSAWGPQPQKTRLSPRNCQKHSRSGLEVWFYRWVYDFGHILGLSYYQ